MQYAAQDYEHLKEGESPPTDAGGFSGLQEKGVESLQRDVGGFSGLQERQESDLHQNHGAKGCSNYESECEPSDTERRSWHLYNYLQRFPAYLNRHLNYRKVNWMSTSDLARNLDQVEQYTHLSMEEQITTRHFLLLDARSKKEYRTSHIHGAIHLPVKAHLCFFVRPGLGRVQNNFFDPPRNTPLVKSRDKPILNLLQRMDKNIEIVIYCAVGYRSGWIGSALSRQGYNVSVLYGGIYKWANEGREIYRFKSDRSNPKYLGLKEHIKVKLRRPKQPKPVKKDRTPRGSMSDSAQNLMAHVPHDHPNAAHGTHDLTTPQESLNSQYTIDAQGSVNSQGVLSAQGKPKTTRENTNARGTTQDSISAQGKTQDSINVRATTQESAYAHGTTRGSPNAHEITDPTNAQGAKLSPTSF